MPDDDQCKSKTFDRLSGQDTRCVLPEGHSGQHDDGALLWCEVGDCRCGKSAEGLDYRPFAGRFLV